MPKGGAKHGWKTTKRKRKFKDCQDAQKAIQEALDNPDDDDKAVGLTKPDYYTDAGEVKYTHNDDGSWTASATLKWRVRQDHSTVAVPDWSWKNMTSDDKQNVASFQEGMKDHEEGHMQVAEQYTKDHPTSEVEGTGATKPDAVKDLQDKRTDEQQNYVNAADKRSVEYDEATKRGASQSEGPETKDADGNPFPGGKDAILNCSGGD